jgi:hypothetical protein
MGNSKMKTCSLAAENVLMLDHSNFLTTAEFQKQFLTCPRPNLISALYGQLFDSHQKNSFAGFKSPRSQKNYYLIASNGRQRLVFATGRYLMFMHK